MKDLYEGSQGGYDREEKSRELGDGGSKGAKYIVVNTESEGEAIGGFEENPLIGYTHFRFCPDDDEELPENQKVRGHFCSTSIFLKN